MENYNETQASITLEEAVAPIEQPAIADEQPMICEEVPENAQNQACCQEKPAKKKLPVALILVPILAALAIALCFNNVGYPYANNMIITFAKIFCVATAVLALITVFKRRITFVTYIPFILAITFLFVAVMVTTDGYYASEMDPQSGYEASISSMRSGLGTASIVLTYVYFIMYMAAAIVFSVIFNKTGKTVFKWIHFALIASAALSAMSVAIAYIPNNYNGGMMPYYNQQNALFAILTAACVALIPLIPEQPFACEKCNANLGRNLLNAVFLGFCAIIVYDLCLTYSFSIFSIGEPKADYFMQLIFTVAIAALTILSFFKNKLGFITEIILTILFIMISVNTEAPALILAILFAVAACVFSALYGFLGNKAMKWLFVSFIAAAAIIIFIVQNNGKYIYYNIYPAFLAIIARLVLTLRPAKAE